MFEKILIADDEPYLIRALSYALIKGGYSVECATNGAEALEKFISFKPHLALIDLYLPGMNGFDVIRIIKNNPLYRHIYIIGITLDEKNAKECLELGANQILTKPFSFKEILRMLQTEIPSLSKFPDPTSPYSA